MRPVLAVGNALCCCVIGSPPAEASPCPAAVSLIAPRIFLCKTAHQRRSLTERGNVQFDVTVY